MKKCPFCAEEIQDEAIKCRFCGEYLIKKKKFKSFILGCFVPFVIGLLSMIVFIFFVSLIFKFFFYKLLFGMPYSPYHYRPPSFGGLEEFLRRFSDMFGQFWERFRDLLQLGPHSYRI